MHQFYPEWDKVGKRPFPSRVTLDGGLAFHFDDGSDGPVGLFYLIRGLNLHALLQVGHRAWLASDEDDGVRLDLQLEVADLEDPVGPGRADRLDLAFDTLRLPNAWHGGETAPAPRALGTADRLAGRRPGRRLGWAVDSHSLAGCSRRLLGQARGREASPEPGRYHHPYHSFRVHVDDPQLTLLLLPTITLS
jgi:hypothetical protein